MLWKDLVFWSPFHTTKWEVQAEEGTATSSVTLKSAVNLSMLCRQSQRNHRTSWILSVLDNRQYLYHQARHIPAALPMSTFSDIVYQLLQCRTFAHEVITIKCTQSARHTIIYSPPVKTLHAGHWPRRMKSHRKKHPALEESILRFRRIIYCRLVWHFRLLWLGMLKLKECVLKRQWPINIRCIWKNYKQYRQCKYTVTLARSRNHVCNGMATMRSVCVEPHVTFNSIKISSVP
jgi:hypothetical protein